MQSSDKTAVHQQWVKCRKKVESKGKRLWLILRGDSVDLLPDAISRPKISIKLCSIGTCTAVYTTVVVSILDSSLCPPRWVNYHLETKSEKIAKHIADLIVDAMGPNSFNRDYESPQPKKETKSPQTSQMANQKKEVPPLLGINDPPPNDPNSFSEKNSPKSKSEKKHRFTQSQGPVTKNSKKPDVQEILTQNYKEEPIPVIKSSKRVHRPKDNDRSRRMNYPLSSSLPDLITGASQVPGPVVPHVHSHSAPAMSEQISRNRLNPFLTGNVQPLVSTPKTDQALGLGLVQENTQGDQKRECLLISGVTNPFAPSFEKVGMGSYGGGGYGGGGYGGGGYGGGDSFGGGLSNLPTQGGVTGFGQNFIVSGTLTQFGGGMSNITPMGTGPGLNGPTLGLQGPNYNFDSSRMSLGQSAQGFNDPNLFGGGMSTHGNFVVGRSNPFDSGMTNSRPNTNPFH